MFIIPLPTIEYLRDSWFWITSLPRHQARYLDPTHKNNFFSFFPRLPICHHQDFQPFPSSNISLLKAVFKYQILRVKCLLNRKCVSNVKCVSNSKLVIRIIFRWADSPHMAHHPSRCQHPACHYHFLDPKKNLPPPGHQILYFVKSYITVCFAWHCMFFKALYAGLVQVYEILFAVQWPPS